MLTLQGTQKIAKRYCFGSVKPVKRFRNGTVSEVRSRFVPFRIKNQHLQPFRNASETPPYFRNCIVLEAFNRFNCFRNGNV